jgi:hypothetical protein
MAASNTLAEYLISLGFQIKDSELRKFKDAALDVDKLFRNLALSIAGAATAVSVFAEKVSESFAGLYYESKRTGESVQHLESL